MSTPKFSPGPWHFREGQTSTGQFGYIEAADHNRIVADLPDYKHPSSSHECDEHNGRLIAAAPELYQSLLEMVEDSDDVDDGELPKISAATLTRARQALAKAVQP
jgi:hypothetical protein